MPLLVEILSQGSGPSFPIKADLVLLSGNVAISHIWHDCPNVIRIQDIQYDCTDIFDYQVIIHHGGFLGLKTARILSLNDVLLKWNFLKIKLYSNSH